MAIARFSRDEFVKGRFSYEAGEDIGLLGPTGSGKTVLAHQLADSALRQNPGLRYTVFQPKPDDSSTYAAAEDFGLQVSRDYPFRKKLLAAKPRGHVYWPAHITSAVTKDVEHISTRMRNALNQEYWKGNVLSFTDDAFLLESKYGCAPEVEQFLIAGRSSGAGVMFALQAPKGSVRSGVSSFHYSQPVHLFFARENVKANRERYGEISMGINPRVIEDVVASLRTYHLNGSNVSEMLYLDRRGPYAAIVSPF